MRTKDNSGDSLLREAFGGTLYQQGRGYYVALEFFAIARGIVELGERLFPDDGRAPVVYRRRSHDFARRLLADDLPEEEKEHLRKDAEPTLRGLLEGLTVAIPGRRSEGSWQNRHFYPYVGDLIHYDAVVRNKKPVSVERYTYRGGGALAYRLLWDDPDQARRQAIRSGIERLVADSANPLGRLAKALSRLDRVPGPADEDGKDPGRFLDEPASLTRTLESPWVEVLREGVRSIVSPREGVPSTRQIDALMHWLPFCIALHQLALARIGLRLDPREPLVLDFGHHSSQVRLLSREHADRAAATVFEAVQALARSSGDGRGALKVARETRTFFTTTLGTVGAMNAMTGIRHLTMSPRLLDAVVLATVPVEMSFDDFIHEILHSRLRLIVSGRCASEAGLLVRADRAGFDENSRALTQDLVDLGLSMEYSDATRTVGVGPR